MAPLQLNYTYRQYIFEPAGLPMVMNFIVPKPIIIFCTTMYFDSSMTVNPVSTVARLSARQSAIEERTSHRLSRLRRVRESRRSQAEESSAKEMPDENVLEEDMFVDNPMMK